MSRPIEVYQAALGKLIKAAFGESITFCEIPANRDRDADLLVQEALDELKQLRADLARVTAERDEAKTARDREAYSASQLNRERDALAARLHKQGCAANQAFLCTCRLIQDAPPSPKAETREDEGMGAVAVSAVKAWEQAKLDLKARDAALEERDRTIRELRDLLTSRFAALALAVEALKSAPILAGDWLRMQYGQDTFAAETQKYVADQMEHAIKACRAALKGGA